MPSTQGHQPLEGGRGSGQVEARALGETQRLILRSFTGKRSIRDLTVDCQELSEAQIAGAVTRLYHRGLLAQVTFRHRRYFYGLTDAGKRVARELKEAACV